MYIPGGHQEMMWSIDVIVPLFGLKSIVLFMIMCLVLFVTLLIFNITLLFTRCVLKLKYNYYKLFQIYYECMLGVTQTQIFLLAYSKHVFEKLTCCFLCISRQHADAF